MKYQPLWGCKSESCDGRMKLEIEYNNTKLNEMVKTTGKKKKNQNNNFFLTKKKKKKKSI